MIKILIVEDDANIAKLVEATVAIGGYEGVVCTNGAEAFEKIEHENFDLILLDVMLPDMSGFEIMQKRTNTDSPVIFITAKQELTDKVRGLRLGAEDYIVKPFEAMELLARIEVILRRVKRTENKYSYGNISVNVEEHTCKCNGEEVYLTPKEFEVLVFFIQHKDVAISRDRLLAAVWGFEYEGETRTIDIHIQQLRKKLNLKEIPAGKRKRIRAFRPPGSEMKGMDHCYEIMAENFPVYFDTGDACSKHDQYFVAEKQFFLCTKPEKTERIQRARIFSNQL